MIIIGIDPGTASTGYGVIRKVRNRIKYLDHGVIRTSPEFSGPERLKTLNKELDALIKKHQPQVLSIEKLFFFKNLKTAIPVSQACGVIMFTAAKNKLPVYEFTPPQVKLTVAGFGRAEKKDVQKKLKLLLKLKEVPKQDDAADGLAIAATFCLTSKHKSV